jgi:WD40 repeat protein
MLYKGESNLFDSKCHIAFSPDSKILASGGNYKIQLWDLNSMKVRTNLDATDNDGSLRMFRLCGLSFSPDGKILASASDRSTLDSPIHLWDAASGMEIAELKNPTDEVMNMTFSCDGNTLISVSKDKNIRNWDVSWVYDDNTLKQGIIEAKRKYALEFNGIELVPSSTKKNLYGGASSPDF